MTKALDEDGDPYVMGGLLVESHDGPDFTSWEIRDGTARLTFGKDVRTFHWNGSKFVRQ
ncbi:MAG: hypothetical protein ACRDT4_13925 [Micromonosporaceae bacterium]